ncbi:MAG: amidase [Flavobacteriaceae bacterium]|nr:amidase [Flavobacteriaceae bacterium]
MNPTSLAAHEIAKAVSQRKISAVEVATAHLKRMEEVNPKINAVVETCHQQAIADAKSIDNRISKGEKMGAMVGVPLTIKIVTDQQDFVTSFGLRTQEKNKAKVDSPLVQNFKNADAIIIGRTNSPAFATRWFTDNNLYGQTLNPTDKNITPGGSSGGASAAVAAGICPVAHATDIAGSIRYPAYACGVHGLRPSMGRTPFNNPSGKERYIGAQLMAVSGPIARTIKDLQISLQAMSEWTGKDPWQVFHGAKELNFTKKAALSIAPDGLNVCDEVVKELYDAADKLRERGWVVDEVECPPIRKAAEVNAVLWMADMQHGQAKIIETENEPNSKFVFEQMSEITGQIDFQTLMDALQLRLELMRNWDQFFQNYSSLICPVSAQLPFNQQADIASPGSFREVYEAQLTQRALPVINIPSLTIATGFAKGRPIGVQFAGPRFREDIILEAAFDLEKNIPKIEICTPTW